MTYIDKLREMHPEWDEDSIRDTVSLKCPDDVIGSAVSTPGCCPLMAGLSAGPVMCTNCWEREYIEPIPHEFERLSKCMIYDKDGERKMRNERVWVTLLDRMYKQHYIGKPYFRIRTESESGGVWEGWVTEEDIREMLEERV